MRGSPPLKTWHFFSCWASSVSRRRLPPSPQLWGAQGATSQAPGLGPGNARELLCDVEQPHRHSNDWEGGSLCFALSSRKWKVSFLPEDRATGNKLFLWQGWGGSAFIPQGWCQRNLLYLLFLKQMNPVAVSPPPRSPPCVRG